MKTMIRGQRAKLSDIVPGDRFQVGFKAVGSRGAFDISCFLLDAHGKVLSDEAIVFYNQKRSPCGGVALLEPCGGDSAVVGIDLSRLEGRARRVVFAATLDGQSISDIQGGHARFLQEGREAARYEFSGGDFAGETALIAVELYFKDVWRVCAVGQGFVGKGLEFLVEHFGGEVEAAAQPPAASPGEQPPAALRQGAPEQALAAASPAAPGAPPNDLFIAALREGSPAQALLAALREGPAAEFGLEAAFRELKGPAVFHGPRTLDGRGATLWTAKGPTLIVSGQGATVRNLRVEVTQAGLSGDESCAILAMPDARARFENVEVRGNVRGIPGEEGAWSLPASLQLGMLGRTYDYRFVADVVVPVACEVRAAVSGLRVEPERLPAGRSQLGLNVKGGSFFNDSVLHGRIELKTACFRRAIMVCGHVVDAAVHGIAPPPREPVRL